MKRIVRTTLAILVLAGAAAGADQPGKQKGKKGKDKGRQTAVVHVAFGTREVEILKTHYRGKHASLPPGLAKKYARTGQLPPGWQKKMQPLPPALERTLPPLPAGYRRGVIDAHAVIYDGTGAIIDVAILF